MTTRRPHGSGTLRKVGEGRYRYQVRADGTTLSRTFAAKNETEANRATAGIHLDLLAEHERTRDDAGVERERRQEWTVTRYADYYLREWAPVHLASSTRQERKGVIERYIKPAIGKMRMADVTATDLQEFYGKLEKRRRYGKDKGDTLSGASIWKVHTAVRAIFTFAVDVNEDFSVNPAAKVAAQPKVDQGSNEKRAVTVDEVERFVALVREQKPEIATAVMLAAWLGTRRSETLALKRKDFDLDAAKVTIRRSVTETPDDGVVVKEFTKNGKRRTVPLDAYTVKILRALFKQQLEARVRFGKAWQGGRTSDDDWVCADGSGAMLAPEHFNAVFRAFTKKHGLDVTPHLLRHALVSQLIAKGYDAVTISAITGHTPAVLLKTYAHAFDSRKQEAIAELGAEREAVRAAQ
ncbi:MAG: site-specific integrase [Coriobacteriia bacterium]|nr:site-specific integrase [Coriobacteriia bacterium]